MAGTIDTADPAITLDAFATTNKLQPTMSATSDEIRQTIQIVLFDGLGVEQNLAAVVQPDGTFSVAVPVDLNEGILSIDASVLDAAGNVTEATESGSISILGGFLSDTSSEPSGSEDSGSLLSLNLGPLSIDI